MIRKFKLTNSLNVSVSLNDLDLFAYNPEGLGVSFANEYMGVNANFIPMTNTINQASLSVNVLFGAINKNYYQNFHSFVNFLNSQPLTLEYETDAGKYLRLCRLNELTKSEINEWNIIDENMVLEFITPWYNYINQSSDNKEIVDLSNDGKIYRQAISGDPPVPVNLFSDPVITTIDDASGTNAWYTTGNKYAWSIVTDNQYVSGYNIAVINQNEILSGNMDQASQNLYVRNIDTTGQTVGDVFLLDFYFKSDRITQSGSNLQVTAYNSAGSIVSIYDIVDNYGSSIDNVATYFIESGASGTWIHCHIAYKPETSNDVINRILFQFQRSDSLYNYFTFPKFVKTDSVPAENIDAYYIYDYVYEEDEMDINVDYYNIVNNSVYMDSDSRSPIEITIDAVGSDITNPSWELWKGNRLIQSDRYLMTIPQGYKLVVSSFPENQYASLIAPDGTTTSAYQSQDLTKTNFITIPVGASTLIFHVGDAKESFRMREEWVIV